MKIIRGDGREWSDDEVQAALTSAFPPPPESYWDALEQKIMARITAERLTPTEWWGYFRGWARLGLIAAGATLLVSGVAAWRAHEARGRVAYRELLGTPSPLPILSDVVGPEARSPREATLRYLLSQ